MKTQSQILNYPSLSEALFLATISLRLLFMLESLFE